MTFEYETENIIANISSVVNADGSISVTYIQDSTMQDVMRYDVDRHEFELLNTP